MLLFPTAGKQLSLEMIVNRRAPEDLLLKLFSNDITPSDSDIASSFTEPTSQEYEPFVLTEWGAAVGEAIEHPLRVFQGQLGNVYGYFVVQSKSGGLLYAERFPDGPYNMINRRDEVEVTPRISAPKS